MSNEIRSTGITNKHVSQSPTTEQVGDFANREVTTKQESRENPIGRAKNQSAYTSYAQNPKALEEKAREAKGRMNSKEEVNTSQSQKNVNTEIGEVKNKTDQELWIKELIGPTEPTEAEQIEITNKWIESVTKSMPEIGKDLKRISDNLEKAKNGIQNLQTATKADQSAEASYFQSFFEFLGSTINGIKNKIDEISPK